MCISFQRSLLFSKALLDMIWNLPPVLLKVQVFWDVMLWSYFRFSELSMELGASVFESPNHTASRHRRFESSNFVCVKFPRFRSIVLPAKLLRRRRVWCVGGMTLTGEARSASFPTTNLTCSGPGLKLNLGGERPGNNLISQSTTFDICWTE